MTNHTKESYLAAIRASRFPMELEALRTAILKEPANRDREDLLALLRARRAELEEEPFEPDRYSRFVWQPGDITIIRAADTEEKKPMNYWRMQLHPAESSVATKHVAESIAAGFIGLDFVDDPGDLRRADAGEIPPTQKDYLDFAKRMQPGDRVLVMAHHFPFALVTVAGDYNYLATPVPEIGVWFRHFRRIDKAQTSYYGDYVTNAHQWERVVMTDTISILNDPNSISYKLIQRWSADAGLATPSS